MNGNGNRERLTRRNHDGGIDIDNLHAALEKLAEYEDAEEQGRLVVIPFQEGDTAFAIVDGEIKSGTVVDIFCGYMDFCLRMLFKILMDEAFERRAYVYEDVGKRVFLTRAEAERELEDDRYCEQLVEDYLNDPDPEKHTTVTLEELASRECVEL